jgi:hypothetical protein
MKGIGAMNKKSLKIGLVGFTAAMMYLFMAGLIDFLITNYILSTFDSINYGVGSAFTMIVFTIPAFPLGFVLFVMMDWGLKRVWYKRSAFGLLPILFALVVPFVWEFFFLAAEHQILIPIASAAVSLVWSIFVVAFQLGLENSMKLSEKTKRGL